MSSFSGCNQGLYFPFNRKTREWIKLLNLDLILFSHSAEIVSVVAPDEKALEQEREKVRLEFEEEMRKMKEDMEAERESNVLLQANMDKLKEQYEKELDDVNKKIQEVDLHVNR